MTLVSSLGFLHFILNIETRVIFQNFPSNDVTPLPNIPSDWLAQLHDAALSSLAMSLVMFPCSLHTDSILKMYLHPIWCKLLFVFHLYHYFSMLSLKSFYLNITSPWKCPYSQSSLKYRFNSLLCAPSATCTFSITVHVLELHNFLFICQNPRLQNIKSWSISVL